MELRNTNRVETIEACCTLKYKENKCSVFKLRSYQDKRSEMIQQIEENLKDYIIVFVHEYMVH